MNLAKLYRPTLFNSWQFIAFVGLLMSGGAELLIRYAVRRPLPPATAGSTCAGRRCLWGARWLICLASLPPLGTTIELMTNHSGRAGRIGGVCRGVRALRLFIKPCFAPGPHAFSY